MPFWNFGILQFIYTSSFNALLWRQTIQEKNLLKLYLYEFRLKYIDLCEFHFYLDYDFM